MKDINEINYYIDICEKQNLSVRELRNKIKNKEYERLGENTKLKLTNSKEENKIGDFIKHPIVIKTDKEIISEKILHQVILENIVSFMKELGEGYSTKSLKRMRQFYLFCKKGSAMPTQLNWSHYCEVGKILSKTGGKYGDNVINKCSNKLMIEVGKKYNERTLFRMK